MRRVAFGVAGLILTAFIAAQEKISTDLQALVDTERSFAHTATLNGVRDSFLEFFADDAIALTPSPTSAKARLRPRLGKRVADRGGGGRRPRAGVPGASGRGGADAPLRRAVDRRSRCDRGLA